MSKKTLIILIVIVLLIILVIGGYFGWNYWQKYKTGAGILESAGETAEKITESATKGVLPSLGTNPLESKPDINPADKANPFKNIKTNPFE